MRRKTRLVRVLLLVPVVIVLLVSVAGCGSVADQAKQDAKKKIEAKVLQVRSWNVYMHGLKKEISVRFV